MNKTSSQAGRPLPIIAYACFTVAYLALANSMQVEWFWILCFLVFLLCHKLNWHPLTTKAHQLTALILVAVIVIVTDTLISAQWKSASVQSPFLPQGATYRLAYAAALLPIALAFFPRQPKLHKNLAVLTGSMMLLSGNISTFHPRIDYFYPLLFAYGVTFTIWLGPLADMQYPVFRPRGLSLKRKSIWQIVFTVALLILTFIGSKTTLFLQRRYGNSVSRWLIQSSNSGIWDQARVGRIRKIILSRRVVLWYEKDGPGGPTNLIGKRFQSYEHGGVWLTKPLRPRRLQPWKGNQQNPWSKRLVQFAGSQSETFQIFDFGVTKAQAGALPKRESPKSEELREDRILLVSQASGTLYVPLRSRAMAIKHDTVHFSRTGTASLVEAISTKEYAVLVGNKVRGRGTPSELNSEIRTVLTELPAKISTSIRALAEEITKFGETPRQKADLIERWFHRNFKYSLEFDRDSKVADPIVDFLIHKKEAWCEFFASGMCLLLRTLDIPCRYVAGYSAHDMDMETKTYTVRSADAHAWVEVYLEDRGWATYDPTPPAGRQQHAAHAKATWFESLTATVWKKLLQFVAKATQFSFKDFLSWFFGELKNGLFWFFNTPLRFILSSLALLTLLIWGFMKRRGLSRQGSESKIQRFSEAAFSPEDQSFNELLRAFDASLRRHGWVRPEHLTPYEIAKALESEAPKEMTDEHARALANFARAYAQIRFLGKIPTADEFAALQQSLP
jgi:hypothetical protein